MGTEFGDWWDACAPSVSEAFVGDFVRVAHPDIFPRIDPTGSTTDLRPARSPFDFVYLGPDGRLAVIETTTLNRPSDVARHVESRLTAVVNSALPVGAFIYVARSPRLAMEKVEGWQRELVAHGVDPDKILFYFRDEVIREVQHPRYDQLRSRFGIYTATHPIDSIEDIDWTGRLGRLAPTLPDLAAQQSPAPEHALVGDLLRSRSGAAIAGPVGVGKTLLAVQVGLHLRTEFPHLYYLDVAGLGAGSARYKSFVLDRFVQIQSPDTLLIVDNAQSGQELMADIVRIWRRSEPKCQLLVVTSRAHPDRKPSDDTPLWGVLPIVRMSASRETLLATARQVLALRGATALEPPTAAVAQWMASFEDVSAFAYAVEAVPLDRLRYGDWRLAPPDALEGIHARYLGDHPDRRRDLAVLSLLGAHNVYVRGSLLQAKSDLLRDGLIFETNVGRRLDLVLCGLGTASTSRLVLDALRLTEVERNAALADVAERSPSTAGLLAVRLRNTGRSADGDALLAQTFAEGSHPWQRVLSEAGLLTSLAIARAVADAHAVPLADIDAELAGVDEDLLADRLWQSTLCEVCEVLGTARRLRLVHTEAVLRRIIRERLAERLAEEVRSQSRISKVWEALVAARAVLPPVFSAALRDALDEVGTILSDVDATTDIWPADVSALVQLLDTIRRVAPAEHHRVTKPFEDDAIRARLADVVARVRPTAIPRLLSELHRMHPAVATQFAHDLADQSNVTKIARAVVSLPNLSRLPAFVASLSTWGTAIPAAVKLARRIEHALCRPAHIERLAYRLTIAPMTEAIRVLRHDAEWVTLSVAKISLTEWEDERGSTLMNSQHLRVLEEALARVDRLVLMHAPTRALLLAADAARYPENGTMLVSVATTLRHADSVAPRELEKFLAIVCTKARLNRAYKAATPQMIAGSLHSIWVTWGDEVAARFITRGLRAHAEAEFARPWTRDARFWMRMSLLGVLDLVGALPVDLLPDPDGFEDAFAIAEPLEPMRGRGQQFQRARGWRGLQVMRETYRQLKPVIEPYANAQFGFSALAVGDRHTLRERHVSAHTFGQTSA